LTNNFNLFFKVGTGEDFKPYPYQQSLAIEEWPDIIKVPTGLGKTAAIVLSWLYKRHTQDPDTPRRLIYCLPMRVLVDQTANNIRLWIDNLTSNNLLTQEEKPDLYVLMGGDIDNNWDRSPEKDAIIVGTQDQLLSRVLNRGYSLSRFRWPMAFGLLNNDCLWVMDEVQLMGPGLATTTQIQAFRDSLGTIHPVRSIWMSATLQRDWLKTIDFSKKVDCLKELILSPKDMETASVKQRMLARKPIKKGQCSAKDPDAIAKLVTESHLPGTLTLVVVNTVKKASKIYAAISKNHQVKASIKLLHSKFRYDDRQTILNLVLSPPIGEGTICVSTQVVEAGVDISATTLITEPAPWSSLVQRFGRCNRSGIDKASKIIWLDTEVKKSEILPYSEDEINQSIGILEQLSDAGLASLPDTNLTAAAGHVIRFKDIIDLFDTSPDLAGMDIDISKYIREANQIDVKVFWRDVPDKKKPSASEPAPSRREVCNAPMKDVRDLMQKGTAFWYWDHIERSWERPSVLIPGMTLMMSSVDGCYTSETGWSVNVKKTVKPLPPEGFPEEGADDDYQALTGWQTIPQHTDAVVTALISLVEECVEEKRFRRELLTAGRWHDIGKTHPVFQTLLLGSPPANDETVQWAKADKLASKYSRKGFRHEMASALVILQNNLSDLVAYLAAAHHGKIRLSLRSIPGETRPEDPSLRFARGVWDGDLIPECNLGDDTISPETVMDLSYMDFGDGPRGESWLSRTIALRDDKTIGPFRLAYLEAILRAADWRVSSSTTGEAHE